MMVTARSHFPSRAVAVSCCRFPISKDTEGVEAPIHIVIAHGCVHHILLPAIQIFTGEGNRGRLGVMDLPASRKFDR